MCYSGITVTTIPNISIAFNSSKLYHFPLIPKSFSNIFSRFPIFPVENRINYKNIGACLRPEIALQNWVESMHKLNLPNKAIAVKLKM